MADIYVANSKAKKEVGASAGDTTELGLLKNKHTKNPLSTFAVNPENVHFETQEAEEQIILILRRHIITNVPWITVAVVLLLAPLVLSFFPLIDFLPPRFQLMALIIWYLLVTAYIFEQFLTWIFNVYIVSDERIVDIDFINLLYKQVSDAKISKVQDVTYKVGGLVRSICNYGDVFIQTAGTEENFVFEAVPQPEKVTKLLQELQVQEEVEALEGRVR